MCIKSSIWTGYINQLNKSKEKFCSFYFPNTTLKYLIFMRMFLKNLNWDLLKQNNIYFTFILKTLYKSIYKLSKKNVWKGYFDIARVKLMIHTYDKILITQLDLIICDNFH